MKKISEKQIQNEIHYHIGSKPTVRLFRNNCGSAYMGKVIKKTPKYIILENYRIVKFGLINGSSDLIGYKSKIIGDKKIAQFLAIECKHRTKATEEQKNFISIAKKLGALAGVAHTVDEAEKILKGES